MPEPSTGSGYRCVSGLRLDTRVTYRRTDLAQWRDVQAQVTACLTCATSDPT